MAQGKTIASIIRVINIIVGIFLGFIGVWKIVTLSFIANIGSKFFCIFMPIFMILFGILIIISEIKKDFGSEYFKFIQTFLGKGCFYLFLSSLSVYQIEDETSDLIGYIYGLILFIFGLMYICFHMCKCSGTLKDVREGLLSIDE
ncbi:hypothetical protein ABPG73_002144 [Tetrahymena malaccensis]